MDYLKITDAFIRMIDKLDNYGGSSDVEWAYKDFRNDLIDELQKSVKDFDNSEFDPSEIVSDEKAFYIGKTICNSLRTKWNVFYEQRDDENI